MESPDSSNKNQCHHSAWWDCGDQHIRATAVVLLCTANFMAVSQDHWLQQIINIVLKDHNKFKEEFWVFALEGPLNEVLPCGYRQQRSAPNR